jgi:ATP-dependent DNA ligase
MYAGMVTLPMLAHPLDDAHRKHLRFPCYVQPKLDGVRMMAAFRRQPDAPRMSLYSRTGKPFDHLLPHFDRDLRGLQLPAGAVLDGELYLHGVGFQTIVSMAKNTKTVATGCRLQYHVYDVVLPGSDQGYESRMTFLKSAIPPPSAGPTTIVLVDTVMAAKEADVPRLLSRFEKDGYEGIMLRDRAAPYAVGKRSNALLKLKSFLDAEFEIVAVEEAGGKDAGTALFVCMTPRGKTFRVRPHGTASLRAQMLRRAAELIGKRLTVRYQELTDGGVPRFPVGVAVRDYE